MRISFRRFSSTYLKSRSRQRKKNHVIAVKRNWLKIKCNHNESKWKCCKTLLSISKWKRCCKAFANKIICALAIFELLQLLLLESSLWGFKNISSTNPLTWVMIKVFRRQRFYFFTFSSDLSPFAWSQTLKQSKKISLFTRFIHLIIVMEIRPECIYFSDTVIGSFNVFLCCFLFRFNIFKNIVRFFL